MVRKAVVFLFVQFKLLALVAFLGAIYHILRIAFGNGSLHHKEIGSVQYVLRINRVKITLAQRQVMYGIQQVGFSFAVVARKAIYLFAEAQFLIGVVLKIDKRKFLQVHGERCFACAKVLIILMKKKRLMEVSRSKQ